MSVKDDATLVIGAGNYFTAASGTALPADLTAPGVAWENIGHTSLEDVIAFASEGGDATTLGTLQKKVLRTKYSPRSETMKINLQQFDTASLKLYYGSNAIVTADGLVGPHQDPQPTNKAYLAIFVDDENIFAIYAPDAEFFRADDVAVTDTESLVSLPINVKPVVYSTNTYAFAVTPLGDSSV